MYTESSLKERCQRILEENGGYIADHASSILLEDPALKDLRAPLEFISKNWRDPLTPALMKLACVAVGGQPEETNEAALALSLMNLSFNIWDDIVDKATSKVFKPTLYGKFGEGTALMIVGLSSAKGFSILNQMNTDQAKREILTRTFWNIWTNMVRAETVNLRLRSKHRFFSKNKLRVIKAHSTYVESCVKIGAVLGGGIENEVEHLANYGFDLGMILELWKDFISSLNLTLELAEKIRSGALPYSLLWAMEHSDKLKKKLDSAHGTSINSSHVKEIVEYLLETNMQKNTLKTIRKFTKKAKDELCELRFRKPSTQTLISFVEAQSQLFVQSLLTLQA